MSYLWQLYVSLFVCVYAWLPSRHRVSSHHVETWCSCDAQYHIYSLMCDCMITLKLRNQTKLKFRIIEYLQRIYTHHRNELHSSVVIAPLLRIQFILRHTGTYSEYYVNVLSKRHDKNIIYCKRQLFATIDVLMRKNLLHLCMSSVCV